MNSEGRTIKYTQRRLCPTVGGSRLYFLWDNFKLLGTMAPPGQEDLEAEEKDAAVESKPEFSVVKLYDAVYACVGAE